MNNKKILVLLKFYKGELNPFDASALECALLTGSENITVLTMAPLSVYENLKSITRLGVKAILVSDKAYAGSDTLATSLVLKKAIEKVSPNVIFCGRQSVDGDTGQIPPQLSKRLNWQLVTSVMSLKDNLVVTRSGEKKLVDDKVILTFEKSYNLRFPSIFSKIGEVEVWNNTDLNINKNACGLLGSPTKVIKTYESTVGRRFCSFVSFDMLDELILSGLKLTKKEVVNNSEKIEVVYYVKSALKQALTICENPIEIKGKTSQEIADKIKQVGAKVVLFSDEEETRILASEVAVLLNTGLCADCTSLRVENGKFIMTRPALGGNITADIVCSEEIALATVRTAAKQNKNVVFGVGYGAKDYIEHIRKFAEKYDAEIVASRKVVDSGIMPYETQVGLTGKNITSSVYVAFGVSGAVQHTCAISGVGRVIAVNSDKNSRIFDYADYGIIKNL